ncbi:ATP-grasp domain-containing protein [uncultured Alistipes sp.]|uniref:ATP-grasp domain-containing protein n=1 Tax=uncultured Alistipes sp. TaxID=538949 RepID=UPI00258CF84A|nr:ATP-grasp domain-containing protein [uncultured Alistipes sp.]
MLTILSTACGAMFMPGFFRCLKENGERKIRIIGVDSAPMHYMNQIVDKFYQVPTLSDSDYINVIFDICQRENVDIVFPHISMELERFAAEQESFIKRGIKLAISNPETLKIANNKLLLYKNMNLFDLEVPRFKEINSVKDFDESIHFLGYPEKDVCIKIADGSGSRGVRIVSGHVSPTSIFLNQKPSSLFISAEDMRKIIEGINGRRTLIAMECLKMPEYTVDLLADNGKVLYIGGRLNIDSLMSIAQISEVKMIPEALNLCKQIVDVLKLDGNIGFDFMFDSDGHPKLTDLNPRITATIILFKNAGINFPYMRIKQLLGEPMPFCQLKDGIKLVRKYDDIII